MKEKHELLSKDLQKLQEKHEKEYEDLARAHFVTVEYITKLTSTSAHYKTKRTVNMQNAKIHAKSVEVNAGVH